MKYTGYIGTYTKKESKGVYSFTLDTEDAKISDIKVAAEIGNPTYLNITDDKKYLYAIATEDDLGGLASYSIDKSTGELTFLNKQMAKGPNPCHVNTDRKHRFLFSTNYHNGTVDSYLLDQENGTISPVVSSIQHNGSGPDPRQEKSHVHFSCMTPDEAYLVAIDLGGDLLATYAVSEEGILTEVNRLELPAGSGPRHLVFHPKLENIVYLATEFSSEVIVLNYEKEDGSFTINQTIRTIPADFTENNQGSAIHITSNGKFVYSGNRGHNSLAIFKANEETGELSFVENVSTEGDWPRDFVLDPTEKFLIATNQESSNLTLFARDTETGKLTVIEKNIPAPEAVCIKFL
ncbi:6-phosphogluconolactonase [Oceanobacillus arenosus]|uniref:6-phosphogluconolactonase n=1 Tax=Oceanobacillus arenosus TaxID=1229153 RepID=A0A3D8PU28_9BACI|nr:lactonase family protein [Oceanobacillus arenosus]RDW18811.1 6-phosphogluconolactonase [Oceanobacillus arenosus]